MKITNALKKRREGCTRLVALHIRARTYGMLSTNMNKEYSKLKEDLGKVPYWVITYLDGYNEALTVGNYAHHMDFRYIMKNRTIVSTHKDSDIYYEKLGYMPSDLIGRPNGYYWAKTNRPYSSMD